MAGSIHYKFSSTTEYSTLKFDGLHISLADLKKAICEHKKLGKTGEFHLQITDAQTKQGVYFYTIQIYIISPLYEK